MIYFSGTWTVSTWPWPRAEFCKAQTLGFAINSGNIYLYELFRVYEEWRAVEICDLGDVDFIEQVDVADFGQFYTVSAYGLNDAGAHAAVCISRIPGADSPVTLYNSYPSAYVPDFACGCNYNGQALIGGIIPGGTLWEGKDVDMTSVLWSKVGSFEFDPEGRSTDGYTRLSWTHKDEQSRIYRLKKLGDAVIAYGNTGITALLPKSQPVSTYGQRELMYPVPIGPNAIAGSENVHGYVDTNYEFRTIGLASMVKGTATEALGVTNHGYKEFLETLTSTPINVSYVPSIRTFYISDGNYCFAINKYGCYSTYQLLTSAGDFRDGVFGFYLDNADHVPAYTTERQDFEIRGLKTIGAVEVGIDSSTKFYGAVDYNYNYNAARGTFETSNWVEINKEGIFTSGVTAREFRIKCKGVDAIDETINIDKMKVRVKFLDKRGIRGHYRIG